MVCFSRFVNSLIWELVGNDCVWLSFSFLFVCFGLFFGVLLFFVGVFVCFLNRCALFIIHSTAYYSQPEQ